MSFLCDLHILIVQETITSSEFIYFDLCLFEVINMELSQTEFCNGNERGKPPAVMRRRRKYIVTFTGRPPIVNSLCDKSNAKSVFSTRHEMSVAGRMPRP
jgi:hypothetical protein